MKFLTIILSFFLLGLSLVPCADETEPDSVEISYEESGSDHDHNKSEDLCSPFCVCNCCHSHLIVQQIFISELGALIFPLKRSAYNAPITSGFIGSLLQPPQV
ncbi:DUF6660 family protein [Marinoscillum furvescens]|uniref:DUF6660 family protein n=1 Tax=Marinoscillum furvescens TaxID=1026 RepID=UPI003743C13C